MAHNPSEPVDPENRDKSLMEGSEGLPNLINQLTSESVSQYVQDNRNATNMQLFSFLALMNAYLPDSYLLMPECQKILGPPDPIHGGPPFEERMEPFTAFINTDSLYSPERVSVIHSLLAQEAVEHLADLGISRTDTVKKLMFSLCGDQPQPHIIQFMKDLLTKRELGAKGKEKFSRLITDIIDKEKVYNAVSVLKTASNKFRQNPIFPQTLSRLYYIRRGICQYKNAERWAKTAIGRAPKNSYVADTLGQVYKNRLIREARSLESVLRCDAEASKAFKDVENKADNEVGPEMEDAGGTLSVSNSFNNRGLFGFIQVAKITFEKLRKMRRYPQLGHKRNLITEVQHKFDFFEWYLTYSKPDMTTLEPPYFWKDVAICYGYYTNKQAADSTSFPGLLDCLNRGLFISKGRRAGFQEAVETVPHLEAIRDDLRTIYERDLDVNAAERYILSNIILSNKMHNSPQFTLVRELQQIIRRFLGEEVGRRSPEFYLLVLLLFWPEEQPPSVQENDEEEEQQATEEDEMTITDNAGDSEDNDEDQETRAEPVHSSLDIDLQRYVTFMREAFDRADYAKYLRGRYLLPLFFLGKGSGLNKWIHRSRLDAIVEREVDAELANEQEERNKKKLLRINEMWKNGEVWQVPEIQDILLPVRVELMPPEHEAQEVFVWAGERRVVASTEAEAEASALNPVLFYLGFTIKDPVVFKVGSQKPVYCQCC